MDPDATLRDLLESVEVGDEEQVSILAEALKHWLDNGGYPPKVIGPWKLGLDWHWTLTVCVCALAGVHVRAVAATMEGGE